MVRKTKPLKPLSPLLCSPHQTPRTARLLFPPPESTSPLSIDIWEDGDSPWHPIEDGGVPHLASHALEAGCSALFAIQNHLGAQQLVVYGQDPARLHVSRRGSGLSIRIYDMPQVVV